MQFSAAEADLLLTFEWQPLVSKPNSVGPCFLKRHKHGALSRRDVQEQSCDEQQGSQTNSAQS